MNRLKQLVLLPILVLALYGIFYYVEKSSANQYSNTEVQNFIYKSSTIEPLEVPSDLDRRKAFLGRELFSDKRLSKGNQVSCHSCHSFEIGGADGRQFSVGVDGKLGIVNAPTVFNSAKNFKQFWNGREEDLFGQIDGPIHDPREMGTTWDEIVEKLKADQMMVLLFNEIFDAEISKDRIIGALVEFETALVTEDSPFDLFLKGDHDALTESQIAGFRKFETYGCVACHQGQNIGGNMFQSMGVAFNYFAERGGYFESDVGRFVVTGQEHDRHVFKVPSLRNVQLTAPYFHDGSEPSLENAVRKMARYQLGRKLPKEDIKDITEFLKSLTGKKPKILSEAYESVKK